MGLGPLVIGMGEEQNRGFPCSAARLAPPRQQQSSPAFSGEGGSGPPSPGLRAPGERGGRGDSTPVLIGSKGGATEGWLRAPWAPAEGRRGGLRSGAGRRDWSSGKVEGGVEMLLVEAIEP